MHRRVALWGVLLVCVGGVLYGDGELGVRINSRQEVIARFSMNVGPTRWIARGRWEYRAGGEERLPGGYSHVPFALGRSLAGGRWIAGVESAWITLGPVALEGVYARLIDPTAGGIGWGCYRERSRVRLVHSWDEPRWLGVSAGVPLSSVRAAGRGWTLAVDPRVVWLLDDSDGEERTRIVQLVVPLTVEFASFSFEVGVSRADARFPQRRESSWLFDAPPALIDRLQCLAGWVTLSVGEWLTVIGEGWRSWQGVRPVRWVPSAMVRVGIPAFCVTTRFLSAPSGSVRLDGQRPTRARIVGTRVEGRYRGVPLRWRLEWRDERGWEGETVAPLMRRVEGRIGIYRSREVVRVVQLSAAWKGEEARWTAAARIALGWNALSGSFLPRITAEGERTHTITVGWRPAVGRARRRVEVTSSLRIYQGADEPSRYTVSCSVPIGKRSRLEGHGVWEDRLSGTVTWRWAW